MVIDHDKKFIFVHVYKTGGTSIEEALGGKSNVSVHERLENIINWKDYFSFGFVRNPWDRAVSSYMFQARSPHIQQQQLFSGTFEEYIISTFLKQGDTKSYVQYSKVKNCNFIGRFEHLHDDFKRVCKDIKVLPVPKLQHIYKTEHKHYSEYYNDELKEIIAETRKGDIETFGFTFEKIG